MEKKILIRLLTSCASTAYAYSAGEEVEASESIANDLVKGGHAEYVTTPAKKTVENTASKEFAKSEKR